LGVLSTPAFNTGSVWADLVLLIGVGQLRARATRPYLIGVTTDCWTSASTAPR